VLVSFIIPLYNCLPLTQAMLASLQATIPSGLPHEIIFVDDGSTDGTRDWLGTLTASPEIRVVLNDRNVGYAAANNRGTAIARGELLALLNNDLVLPAGWLQPVLAAHREQARRAGVVGNIQVDAKSGAIDHAGIVVNDQGKPVHLRAFPPRAARISRNLWSPPAVTGACLFISRDLWQQLGGFDESYVNGGEDIDLCFRARAAGRSTVVALDSVIRHHVSSSPGRKLRDEQNSYRLARKWRHDFIAAADYGTRIWCRDYLTRAFAVPDPHEHRLTLAALAFLTRLRRKPPREAVAGVEAGLAREFARWEEMFGT
jgi:GT2 family glycosyltransferase